MYEQDYVMRIIHEMVRMLIKLVLGIDTERYDQIEFKEAETKIKYNELHKLLDAGDICGAEDELVEGLNIASRDDFLLALLFYRELSNMSEEYLNEHNFSKQEVYDGLKYVAELYGYGDITDMLSMEE